MPVSQHQQAARGVRSQVLRLDQFAFHAVCGREIAVRDEAEWVIGTQHRLVDGSDRGHLVNRAQHLVDGQEIARPRELAGERVGIAGTEPASQSLVGILQQLGGLGRPTETPQRRGQADLRVQRADGVLTQGVQRRLLSGP